MNRFILKHGYLVTFVILAIFAWFIYRQFIALRSPIVPFAAVTLAVWGIGTFVFIHFWPSITYAAFRRAIVRRGLGGGPIPVNTLYAAPEPAAPAGGLLATGTGDVLYVGGWLDLSKGPLVLHVPETDGRYYGVQLTDPRTGADFAYVSTRATGTHAGDYLIAGPGWKGRTPEGMALISSPHRSAAVIGRVLVKGEGDLPAAYGLARQIRLTPLGEGQTSP
jgi:hypothetical protein